MTTADTRHPIRTHRNPFLPFFLAMELTIQGLAAHAQTEPLWEAGAGVGLINFPDYRGSDERHVLILPFPYVIYRGEIFKVDRQGVRGLLLSTDRVEFDISLNATPPVDSRDNRARQGMDDLDPTIEIGPSLNLKLLNHVPDAWDLELRFPLRASIATDLTHARSAGWVFQPSLALDFHDFGGWKVGFLSGLIFGDRRQHQYFYGVPPEFATASRPAYQADGGYAGAYLLVSLSRRINQFWVGAFLRADSLRGAVFDDSPLVRSKQATYAGIAFAWVFTESKERVPAER